MTIVSTLEIRLLADLARLQQDMDRARQTVGNAMDRISASVGNAMKMIAGFAAALTVGAFVSFIKGGIDAADSIDELREKTGLLMKDVAGVRLIFQREGFGDQELVVSMSKLSKAITEGGGALGALKISTKDASGEFRSTKDVLYDVADRFAAMDNGAQKSALAMDIFGKSGVALIPMLNGGSEGMREMAEMAEKLGLVISQETATAAGDFNDTLFLIGQGSQGVAQGVAAELLPTLNSLAGSFLTGMTSGQKLSNTAAVLGGALKILYTIAVVVAEVFLATGRAIGAAAAMTVAVLQGNFKEVAEIYKAHGEEGAKSLASSAKMITDAWDGTGEAAVAAAAKSLGAQKDLLAAQKEREAAEKKAAADHAASIKAAQDYLAGLKVEASQIGLSADQVKMLAAARAAAKAPTAELRMEIMAGALALDIATKAEAAKVAAEKEVIESNKRAAEGLAAYTAMQKAYDDQVAKSIQSANEEADKNEELVKTFGMTKAAIEKLELARLQDQLAQRSSTGLTFDEITALELLIAAKQRSAAAVGSLEGLEKQKKASDEAAAAQVSFWKSIDDTAHDTFVSIANGSKDTAQRLKDTFKNVFFDWLYQMTIKKWIVNIGASVSGTAGVSGLAQAAGMESSGSSAFDLVSMGKKIYDGFTTGFAGVGTTLGGYVTTLGNLFGSSATSAFGAGMGLTSSQAATAAAAYNSAGMTGTGSALTAGSTAGAAAGVFAGVAGGVYGGRLISGGYGSNSAVNTGTAIGAVVGSIIPVLGTALGALIGGAIGGVWNRTFGMKAKEITSTHLEGTLTPDSASANLVQDWTQKGGWFRSDKKGTETSALGADEMAGFSDAYKAILDLSKTFGETLGVSTAALSSRVQKLSVDLTGLKDAAAQQEAVAKFFAGVSDTIALELVPNLAEFQLEGETLSATLQRVTANYATVDALFEAIGKTVGAVGVAGITARERLIEAAGGLDALSSGISFFQQNVLTDAQRLAPVQKAVAEALAEMGQSGLTTVGQFSAATLAIDTSTESGAKLFAKMLALAPAFKQVADAADAAAQAAATQAAEVAAAAAQVAAAQAEIAAALAATEKDYQDQINALLAARQGEAAVRALDTAGMAASTVALYDHLKALQAQDAAIIKLKQDLVSVTTARAGIADEIFNATLGGLDVEGKIAMLSKAESDLWNKVGTDADSLDVLAKIKSLAMSRIELEGQLHDKTISDMQAQYALRKDALTDELEAMLRMQSFAARMKQFADSLKVGQLTALSPTAQLAEAYAQYQAVLSKAQANDAAAQANLNGVAQTYLELKKQYEGSGAEFASAFNTVVGDLEQFANLAATDAQLEAQQLQIRTIESTSAALSNTVRDTGNQQVEVLTRIDETMKKSEESMQDQLAIAGAVNAELVTQLEKTNSKLSEIEARMARMEMAG